METHHHRPRVLCAITLPHVAGPDAARGAQLRDLLEEVVVNVPEEGKARSERVHVQAARDAPLDVREPIGQREGELLRCGRPGLPDVIAGDRDRVPQGRVCGAPLEHVDDDLERRLDGIHPGVLGHVFLENVVLHRAPQRRARHALLLGCGDVEAEQHRSRPVDGHRGGDAIERNPAEQVLHVGERRNRDAALPYLTLRPWMVGVVPHQGREIERHRETGLPMVEQKLVAPVRVLGAPEPRELTHRPQLAAVHGGVDAAGERVLTRHAEPAAWLEAGQIIRRINRLPVPAAHRFSSPAVPAFIWSRISPATSYGLLRPSVTSSSRRATSSSTRMPS